MAQEEIIGRRDLTYSCWHRTESIKRFISENEAKSLCMMDIDYCEFDGFWKKPLALIEVAQCTGIPNKKNYDIMKKVADKAKLGAYVIHYELAKDLLPSSDNKQELRDIKRFFVERVDRNRGSINQREFTPVQMAEFLLHLDGLRPWRPPV